MAIGLGKKQQAEDPGVSLPPADAVADTEPPASPPPSKSLSLEERVAKIERYLRAQGFEA